MPPAGRPPARLIAGSGRLDKSVLEIELVRVAKDALSVLMLALVALPRPNISGNPSPYALRILAPEISTSSAGNERRAYVPAATVNTVRTVNPSLPPTGEGGFGQRVAL